MRQLWVLRHAKSSWDDPTLADHDRPLAPRGIKAARRIGRWAAEHDVRPDLVLCSTAVRARASLDLVSEALRSPPVQFEDELYHAWEETLVERLRRLPAGVATVMVVGHNPGLENLVSILAPAGPERLPTGALVGLRLGIDEWRGVAPGCAEVTELVLPREL